MDFDVEEKIHLKKFLKERKLVGPPQTPPQRRHAEPGKKLAPSVRTAEVLGKTFISTGITSEYAEMRDLRQGIRMRLERRNAFGCVASSFWRWGTFKK
jgi:hypothetical protein